MKFYEKANYENFIKGAEERQQQKYLENLPPRETPWRLKSYEQKIHSGLLTVIGILALLGLAYLLT